MNPSPRQSAYVSGKKENRQGFIRRPMSAVADFGRHRPKPCGRFTTRLRPAMAGLRRVRRAFPSSVVLLSRRQRRTEDGHQTVRKLQLILINIEDTYSTNGQHAYHPKTLLKILVYGYLLGIRSSRKLADRLNEDIVFMWLSSRQTPDFRTIADFRKDKQ